MDPGASLVERLVLLAIKRGEDGSPDGGSTAQSVDMIARRSGIKHHEVQRVLVRLETRDPPTVSRIAEEDGRELWQFAEPEAERAEVARELAT